MKPAPGLRGAIQLTPVGFVLCSFEHPLEFALWIQAALLGQLERDVGPARRANANGERTGAYPVNS